MLVCLGQRVAWKMVSFFFVKPQSLRAKKLNKKGVFPGRKATGLATGTTAQITACKKLAHRPSSVKESVCMGIMHSYSDSQNILLLMCVCEIVFKRKTTVD